MARQKRPFDAVQFTRESAERIAGVVRAAELATPAARPLSFNKRFPERVPKQVRAATFTGSWAIGSVKTVTFKYAPTATQTVANLSWPITHNHVAPEDCIVGKEGTSWWLVVPVLQAQTAVFVTAVLVSATLNTNNCTISVSTTASTATATFLRLRVP